MFIFVKNLLLVMVKIKVKFLELVGYLGNIFGRFIFFCWRKGVVRLRIYYIESFCSYRVVTSVLCLGGYVLL